MTIDEIFSDSDIYNGHLFISSEGAPSQSVANAPPSWPRPITLIRGRMPGEGIFGDSSMARQMPEDNSTTYFSFLEAFAQRGCPLCWLLQAHSTSYLDSLFYERVTDVETRRKLRRARRLCHWHTWEASKKTPAALGVAIIAHDLIDEELTRLAALRRSSLSRRIGLCSGARIARRSLRAYLRGWRQRGMCPACQVIVEHERYALKTLLDCLPAADFAPRFRASDGLCLPHTVRALALHPSHPALGRLIATQHEKCAGLMAELDEFSRKHDYRFGREAWGAESDSWRRAIDMLAGNPWIGGSDMPELYTAGDRGWGGIWRFVSGVRRLARRLMSQRLERFILVTYSVSSSMLLSTEFMSV